jgi:hypothetical protein
MPALLLQPGDTRVEEVSMAVDPDPPRWKTLCEAAKDEKDPKKLMRLVQEINQELDKADTYKPRADKPRG